MSEYSSIFTSTYIFPRGPAGEVTLQPKPEHSSTCLPCFSVSKSKMCGQGQWSLALRLSLPGFGRDLGWLHWQGTHRVTQIYLQHSSISLHTRCCCWLRETWIASERTMIPIQRDQSQPPSALNITFVQGWFPDAIISISALCIACICAGNHAENYLAFSGC